MTGLADTLGQLEAAYEKARQSLRGIPTKDLAKLHDDSAEGRRLLPPEVMDAACALLRERIQYCGCSSEDDEPAVDFEFEDAVGNQLKVEAVTSAVARLTVYDDDSDPMVEQVASVLIGPEDAQRLADAVRQACTPEPLQFSVTTEDGTISMESTT